MKIGIDARLWNETGVGRYIRALVFELGSLDHENEYTLFLKQKEFDLLSLPNKRWHKVLADIGWHSVAEQLMMPNIYEKAEVDILHIPYFSVPILTKVPFVVTIHDLTISHFATGKATTRPFLMYATKWLAYKFILSRALAKAETIITVSETVKKQLLEEYKLTGDRVQVTYEAGQLENDRASEVKTPDLYLLYVGNAHPHKNLENLLLAFRDLKKDFPKLNLVLIGPNDFFYERLKKFAAKHRIADGLRFLHGVTTAELATWYQKAGCLVFPSLAEGFGIPGLEAMSQGTLVAASDIAVFHEIYGEAAIYFDQKDIESIKSTLAKVVEHQDMKKDLAIKVRAKAQEYSWRQMAEETLHIYEQTESAIRT